MNDPSTSIQIGLDHRLTPRHRVRFPTTESQSCCTSLASRPDRSELCSALFTQSRSWPPKEPTQLAPFLGPNSVTSTQPIFGQPSRQAISQ